MPDYARYQSSGPRHRPPDDLVVGVADHRNVDGIAAVYAAREGITGEQSRVWAQRVFDRSGDSAYLVTAESGGRVIGYGLAEWLDHESAPEGFYLLGVAVDVSFRRMGIAHAITQLRMDWIRKRAHAAFYFANASNSATIDLHDRFGFREVLRASEFAGVTFDGGVGILYRASLTATVTRP